MGEAPPPQARLSPPQRLPNPVLPCQPQPEAGRPRAPKLAFQGGCVRVRPGTAWERFAFQVRAFISRRPGPRHFLKILTTATDWTLARGRALCQALLKGLALKFSQPSAMVACCSILPTDDLRFRERKSWPPSLTLEVSRIRLQALNHKPDTAPACLDWPLEKWPWPASCWGCVQQAA